MPDVTVSIRGEAALTSLLAGRSGPAAYMLARKAVLVESAAKARCPVDTGRLRASITWALGGDSEGVYADIGTNVLYAPYVELGTSRMRARPFLRPALSAAR
jgi:HK97 gp10 family phage protein